MQTRGYVQKRISFLYWFSFHNWQCFCLSSYFLISKIQTNINHTRHIFYFLCYQLPANQGRPQWGGRGGTGHPWDFNISETGDTIHQIRWHTWAWVKTHSLKSDIIQTNYFPILLATLNVFVNIQFSALFDL